MKVNIFTKQPNRRFKCVQSIIHRTHHEDPIDVAFYYAKLYPINTRLVLDDIYAYDIGLANGLVSVTSVKHIPKA